MDLVAIHTRTHCAIKAYQLAESSRTRGAKVALLGGLHPTLLPAEAVAHADGSESGRRKRLGLSYWKISRVGNYVESMPRVLMTFPLCRVLPIKFLLFPKLKGFPSPKVHQTLPKLLDS